MPGMETPVKNSQHFHQLSPDDILNAIDDIGYRCDGHVSALNSYENRVYQVGIEDEKPVIAKFYRPERWTDEAIREEHRFTFELTELEIPVIAPLRDDDGESLFKTGPYRFSIYPRIGGRAPELDDPEHLLQLGRCLARVHSLSETADFKHRPSIDVESYVIKPFDYLLENNFIPIDLRLSYEALQKLVTESLLRCYDEVSDIKTIRLHGDCHLGNILWCEEAPFLVDFDDARTGPAIQDLWMLLSGDREYMTARLYDLLEGYTEFRNFEGRELRLIEALRTMRMIHHAGWLAQRWDDPAFPMAFPWFNTQQFWEDHILNLKEQLAMMDEPPLEWIRG
jgi:Ser/Thr protein kinase RdoA (MazF antagonist)